MPEQKIPTEACAGRNVEEKRKKVTMSRDETEGRASRCASGEDLDAQPSPTFPEQERLLHAAFRGGQIKRTFALGVSAPEVSAVVPEQVDDVHAALPGCGVQGRVQPLAAVDTGS